MKSATDEIQNELGKRGYRITEARKHVIEKLASQRQPVTIQALCAVLPTIDEASVYRTVRLLLREGFLEEIVLVGGIPKYALAEGHHHHVVCTSCGIMKHIACTTIPSLVPSGFQSIASHEVTLYGLCKKCA